MVNNDNSKIPIVKMILMTNELIAIVIHLPKMAWKELAVFYCIFPNNAYLAFECYTKLFLDNLLDIFD